MSGSNFRPTMARAWESYLSLVLPPNAGPTQIQECRRAFYAGAESLHVLIMHALDPGSEPTEADLRFMEALYKELQQFATDVMKGVA